MNAVMPTTPAQPASSQLKLPWALSWDTYLLRCSRRGRTTTPRERRTTQNRLVILQPPHGEAYTDMGVVFYMRILDTPIFLSGQHTKNTMRLCIHIKIVFVHSTAAVYLMVVVVFFIFFDGSSHATGATATFSVSTCHGGRPW